MKRPTIRKAIWRLAFLARAYKKKNKKKKRRKRYEKIEKNKEPSKTKKLRKKELGGWLNRYDSTP